MDAIVHDISEDGALVEANQIYELRTPVDLVFPVRTEEKQRWLRIMGEVARVNNGKIGILFQEIDQGTRNHLRSLLAHGTNVADVPLLAQTRQLMPGAVASRAAHH